MAEQPLDTKPKTTGTNKAIVANAASGGLVPALVTYLLLHFKIDLGLSDEDVVGLTALLSTTLIGVGHWIATRAFFQRIFAPAPGHD